MRWLMLLLIPLGLQAKEVRIPCATWYEGQFSTCEAAIIGEVIAADSHVERSPSQVLPEETCLIRVDDIVGHSTELQGATTVKLVASYIHDTYLQLEPDWGVYRHLQPGQKVVALIHWYEHDVAIGSDALVVLKPETMSLPQIIQRTGFDAAQLTDADLVVWKAACPWMFPMLADIVAYERERDEEERRMGEFTPGEWLVFAAITTALLASGGWLVRRGLITRSRP